jgi:hypothetical protein
MSITFPSLNAESPAMCIIFTARELEISFSLKVNSLLRKGGTGTIKARIIRGKASAFDILRPRRRNASPITATHTLAYVKVSIEPSLPAIYRAPENNKTTNPSEEGRHSCALKLSLFE